MRYIIDLTCLMLQLVYFVSAFLFCVHGVYGAFSRVLGLLHMFLEHLDLVFLSSLFGSGVFFFLVWGHVDTIHAEAREDSILSGKS